MTIQDVVVIASGMKPVITPTYRGLVIPAIKSIYHGPDFLVIP